MVHATLTALFSYARAAVACAVLGLALAPSAFALGGDDLNTGTKVNANTKACQAKIANAGAYYANSAAAAMNACLAALVNCDEAATPAAALTCRRALLVPKVGLCAVGKVDEGASMLGNGTALHAQTMSTSLAKLLVAMRSYTTGLQNKCFTPLGVDLGSIATGLGFSPTPGDKLALADATNQDPGGIQCLANGLVLKTHPLASDMTSLLETLDGTCVKADAPGNLGIPCATNTTCGPTLGRCGALAKVFRQGSIKPCAAPPPVVAVCGNGVAESPEQCDDNNLANGDGCSSTCTLEVPLAVVCGNGVAQGPTEQCDDGNTNSGDGCSSTCNVEPNNALLETGQTTCWNSAGTVISCAGTGQDGELQKGGSPIYTDPGDGTVTDLQTGLMWEKLDDNNVGGIHDWNNTYTWDNAFAVKIAALNTPPCFAARCDWRLPNRTELLSIVNLEDVLPAVSPAFNTSCTPGCTSTSCSCTQSDFYWSSSSYAYQPGNAWIVDFGDGGGYAGYKTYGTYVRAVRGGP